MSVMAIESVELILKNIEFKFSEDFKAKKKGRGGGLCFF